MIDKKSLIKRLNELKEYYEVPKSLTIEIEKTIKMIENELKLDDYNLVDMWFSVNEAMPLEYIRFDDETGYYKRSKEVLCFCKDDYNGSQYWIDYTIDGEWQNHDYCDGDKLFWKPISEPCKGVI